MQCYVVVVVVVVVVVQRQCKKYASSIQFLNLLGSRQTPIGER